MPRPSQFTGPLTEKVGIIHTSHWVIQKSNGHFTSALADCCLDCLELRTLNAISVEVDKCFRTTLRLEDYQVSEIVKIPDL